MTNAIPTMIVPTLNGHDRVYDLFATIDYPIRHAVIIDNGDKFEAWPDSPMVDKVSVIVLPSNLGVAASWNLGIKVTPFSPYWFIVNDDVTFPAGAIEKFAWHGEHFGAISLAKTGSPWCAFILGTDVVAAVGLFDEVFYPAYFEDTDYARRARHIMGDDIIYDTNVVVNHANSSTINSGFAEHNNKTFHANHRTFEAKVTHDRFDVIGWEIETRHNNDWGV